MHHIRCSRWMKLLTSGCAQVSPVFQKSSSASLFRETHSITCGERCRKTRAGRLFATTAGGLATDTEKLGCVRPGRTKYLTRGPCDPIAVEMKIVPGTPVCWLVRLAISTTSSHDNSSASDISVGSRAPYSAVVTRPAHRRAGEAKRNPP